MVVIIPNPNDQLQLVKLQEKLCSRYSTKDDYMCKVFPLWIPLPLPIDFAPDQLKQFSKTLRQVTIYPPQENLLCPVAITTDTEVINTSLELVRSKQLKKIDPQAFQPVSLKIFRFGIKNQKSPNTVSITDSVWVKL